MGPAKGRLTFRSGRPLLGRPLLKQMPFRLEPYDGGGTGNDVEKSHSYDETQELHCSLLTFKHGFTGKMIAVRVLPVKLCLMVN